MYVDMKKAIDTVFKDKLIEKLQHYQYLFVQICVNAIA